MLLPYVNDEIFELVASVDEYEEFLPWCKRSRILERTANEIVADMQVVIVGHEEEIVTRNRFHRNEEIDLELIKGPFSVFQGKWRFTDLGVGCKATLDLSFQLDRKLLHKAASPLFDVAINRVIDAFTARARATLQPCE